MTRQQVIFKQEQDLLYVLINFSLSLRQNRGDEESILFQSLEMYFRSS